ncbi:hypothetical protein ACLOJK_041648 [Asimina triloba]
MQPELNWLHVIGFLTNIIVTAMLLLRGSAAVNALTGVDIYAASFLIPLGVIVYTLAGGLQATFLASYIHSVIGSSEGMVEMKQPHPSLSKETALPLPLVTVTYHELPHKPSHYSNGSDSPCMSESGSDILNNREVITKLRQQLKTCCQTGCAYGEVLFSSLPPTLTVQASLRQGSVAVLKSGEDIITVIWGLNGTTHRGVDSQYKKAKVELCYAPISQQNRGPYTQSNKEVSIDWMIKKDVPTATYFVRAYAVDASGKEVAYGQNTDKNKATNLFSVQGISGRHASLDIAAACFSAFAVVSLFGFFYEEKRKAKKSQGSCEL